MKKQFSKDPMGAIGAIGGGQIEAAVKTLLRRMLDDCDDRPYEEKTRKLVITVEAKPVRRQDGATTDVEMTGQVKVTVPTHKSDPVTARFIHGGDAWFNDLAEDNPDQLTIDQLAESKLAV
jgi:hypothetical protein